MKKKTTKNTKNKRTTKEQLVDFSITARRSLLAHGVFVMFVIAGLSIGFALYKSSAYLTPTRDEAKYNELTTKASYSKIDYKLVQKLSEALSDTDIKVGQNINPGRSNPFSE